jgi:anthranilate/para-aminobenzoate synthase component II
LTIEETTLPDDWIVSARSQDDHEVMGIRHRTLPLEGVQFHPESVLSEGGRTVVQNFVARVTATSARS